jgi:DNA-nicking Smr family endonuclease
VAAGPDEDALWRRVIETVTPLKGRRPIKPSSLEGRRSGEGTERALQVSPSSSPPPRSGPPPSPLKGRRHANTLDASWDRRLKGGGASPDATIDLHGFTVARAHGELEAGLARAVARGARVVLLVTGRPPPPGRSRLDDPLRGIIRASVGDWLEHSPHASKIAAIRPAHPRHGGAGALYLVLRRARP